MGARGSLFAFTDGEAQSIINAPEHERWELLNVLEGRVIDEWWCDVGTAWEAIHRCLTDGTVREGNGPYPLNRCLLGGRELHNANATYVYLVSIPEVRDVAGALSQITDEEMRRRYSTLRYTDYASWASADDEEYTLEIFGDVHEFYRLSAQRARAVVFDVSF